jgi:hypothetical protein
MIVTPFLLAIDIFIYVFSILWCNVFFKNDFYFKIFFKIFNIIVLKCIFLLNRHT